MFGGEINFNSIQELIEKSDGLVEEEWVYINFNDFYMAFNTLFGMMWENDSEQYIYMFQLAKNLEKNGEVIFFFVSFM